MKLKRFALILVVAATLLLSSCTGLLAAAPSGVPYDTVLGMAPLAGVMHYDGHEGSITIDSTGRVVQAFPTLSQFCTGLLIAAPTGRIAYLNQQGRCEHGVMGFEDEGSHLSFYGTYFATDAAYSGSLNFVTSETYP